MPSKRKPSYRPHHASGQARVTINGQDIYLGPYGSPESYQQYDEIVREWFKNQQHPERLLLTCDDLALLYLDFAGHFYLKNGEPTSRIHVVRLALRYLVQVHGRTPVRRFSPRRLKEVRAAMVEAGYARTTVNDLTGIIRQAFRWAAEEEYCSHEVWQELQSVRNLQKGRTDAKEKKPVPPVSEEHVNAVLPYCSPQVRDMVRLQLLTGCRPGEICLLRPRDLEMDGNVWLYRPESHKIEHYGRERIIFVGPRGQEILRPWLDRAREAYCFSPAEAESERQNERRKRRKTKVQPSQQNRSKQHPRTKPGERYTATSYRRAIQYACEIAFKMPPELRYPSTGLKQFPEGEREGIRKRRQEQARQWRRQHVWTPNQMRHSRATIIRKTYGIEPSALILGHSNLETSQVYAERDLERAKQIMIEIG